MNIPEVDAPKAENEKLRKDVDRLLVAGGKAVVYFSGAMRRYGESQAYTLLVQQLHDNLREAIDAAMADKGE